jgi:GH24 family phage-related lysozyme (muramidase)
MSGDNTTTTSSQPPQQVLQNYTGLTNAASSLAGQPLNLYSGPMISGFTPDQQAGFAGVENSQGIASPYIDAAAQEYGQATNPLYNTVNQYQSPYTQDVTQSLQNLYDQQNATQLQQVAGNATSAGAYGGDREAVAQALTAQQQQLAEAPTLSQAEQTGYQTALSADEAQGWLNSQAGAGLANLGTEAQSSALTGANALVSAGGLQQQLAQEQLNIPYQEFQAAQAYPYQTLGFEAPIIEGTGSLSGGTGSTTSPGQTPLSQIAGLGLTGLGAYGLYNNLSNSGAFASAGGDAGYVSDLAKRGGRITHHAGGGRIGLAAGGTPMIPGQMNIPLVSGIGGDVPNVNLSFIPQGIGGGGAGSQSMFGLSPTQPVTSTTQTQSGGILGDIGPLLSLAKLATLAFKAGGRLTFDDGGSTAVPGQSGSAPFSPVAVSSSVPSISLDRIIHPGPAIKGGGPPHPPGAQGAGQGGFGMAQGLQALQGAKSAEGLFGGGAKAGTGTEGGDTSSGLAKGGHIHRDDGGASSVPIGVAAQYGGAPPQVSGALQQLQQLPISRLQEMSVQFPPNTSQGQLVAMALRQKQAYGSGQSSTGAAQQQQPVANVLAQGQAPAGQAQGTASAAQQPQDYGGTSHAMAAGGDAGHNFVTEDELDPQPVVDHTGDTVKIRYPSEGKTLDLGLPPVKPRRALAGGGAAGMTSFTAGNGVRIPQLGSSLNFSAMQTDPLTGGAFQSGGGSGNWMIPLAQYQPPGESNSGPSGSMVFPSFNPSIPQQAGVVEGLWNTGASSVNPVLGGTSGQGGANAAGPASSSALTIDPNAAAEEAAAASSAGEGGGGKRGGNVRHFDDGGDTGSSDDAPPSAADYGAMGIHPPTTDVIGLGAPSAQDLPGFSYSWPTTHVSGGTDIGTAIPDIVKNVQSGDTERAAEQKQSSNPWARISGTSDNDAAPKGRGLSAIRSGSGDTQIPSGDNSSAATPASTLTSGLAAPSGALHGGLSSSGAGFDVSPMAGDSGEPSAPQAMTTPDRGPPPMTIDGKPAIGGVPLTHVPGATTPLPHGHGSVISDTSSGDIPAPSGLATSGANVISDQPPQHGGLANPAPPSTAPYGGDKPDYTNGDFIRAKEGVLTSQYNDVGHPAIGIGHDITPAEQQQGYISTPGGRVPISGGRITPEQAEQIFQGDWNNSVGEIKKVVPNFDSLNSNQKEALVSYVFNTGHLPTGAAEALAKGDMQGVANSLRNGIKTGQGVGYMPQLAERREQEADLFMLPEGQHLNLAISRGGTGGGSSGPSGFGAGPGISGGGAGATQVASAGGPSAGAGLHGGMNQQQNGNQGGSQRRGFNLGDYGMPLLLAGLSSLSSRSPNAVAEGIKAASPYFTAAERAQATANNADVRQQANASNAAIRQQAAESNLAVRQQAIESKAYSDAQTLQFKLENLARQQQQGDQSLALRQQVAETQQQLNEAKLRIQEAAAAAKMAQPRPGYNAQTGESGTWKWNGDKMDYEFVPGASAGKPPAVTSYQQKLTEGRQLHPGDEQAAANYAANQSGFRDAAEYEREVTGMMGQLKGLPAYQQASPQALRNASEQMVLANRAHAPGGQQRAAPAHTAAPTSAVPAGATGQRRNPDGTTTYWVPGKGEVTPGAPAQASP